MLAMMRSDDMLILVSDDKNGENAFLEEAIGATAPHLLPAYGETKQDEDGLLRFRVGQDDWEALADVIEELSCMSVAVNPNELAAIEDALRVAISSQ